MTESKVDLLLKEADDNKKPVLSVQFLDPDGLLIKTLEEEDLKKLSTEVLTFMLSDVRKYKDFGMSSKLLGQMIDLKKAWWPATQKNLNANVDLFSDQLNEWKDAYVMLNIPDKKKSVIVNDK